uniref:Uncharacterized protein n=3 Tax=Oryza TaxID=4527 RepID=Q6YV13_ORYSJ|nr:unknown [Oryza sativa Japonica Group]BAD08116.1 hypothetical protein [Oryza sativa Japonica Group]
MSIFEDWACKSWRTHHYELRRASSKTGPANPGELTTMSIFEDWAGKSWRIDKSPQALRYRWLLCYNYRQGYPGGQNFWLRTKEGTENMMASRRNKAAVFDLLSDTH